MNFKFWFGSMRRAILTTAILAVIVWVLLVLTCRSIFGYLPSTNHLLDRFESVQPTLTKLKDMIKEDGLTFVSAKQTSVIGPGSLDTKSRKWRDYEPLLREAGIAFGIEASKDGCINFWSSKFGSVFSGAEKGYAYCEEPPTMIVPDVENARMPSGDGLRYQRIRDNWYIVLCTHN